MTSGYVVAGWVADHGRVARGVLALDRACGPDACRASWRAAEVDAVRPPSAPRRAPACRAPRPAAVRGRGRLCVVAVVAIVVLAVVLSGNVVYFRTVSEAVAQRQDQGDRPLPHRRRGRARHRSPRRPTGVRFGVTDGDDDGRRSTTPATRPSCSRTARRSSCEGHWAAGVRHVRLRPDPDQARQRLRAAEGRRRVPAEAP